MPSLRDGLQELINSPGSVTKSELGALLQAHPLEPGDTINSRETLLTFGADAVFRSDGGCLYNKEGGPGEDRFHEAGNSNLHHASDIGLPAILLSDGTK